MVDRAKILNAVKTAIEKAPERKFSESIDITINLKNIDMAQPKNRIDETIMLPHGTGEKIGICKGNGKAGMDLCLVHGTHNRLNFTRISGDHSLGQGGGKFCPLKDLIPIHYGHPEA